VAVAAEAAACGSKCADLATVRRCCVASRIAAASQRPVRVREACAALAGARGRSSEAACSAHGWQLRIRVPWHQQNSCKYERRTQAPVHQSRPGSYQRIRCSGRKRVAHSHDRSCLPKHAPCLLQEGRLHWECSQMKHKQAAESLRGSARALLVPRAVARAAFEAGCDARLRTAPLPAHSASPRANASSGAFLL
jgi:hypothetical protein